MRDAVGILALQGGEDVNGLGLQEGLCAAMARPPMWSKVRWPF